jgi:site-specific recombinase XerD
MIQTADQDLKKQSPNSLSYLIDKFLFYCEYEKNTSPKTLENYSLWLNRLVQYIGDIDVEKLKPMYVLDFRMWLTQKRLNKKTINYHIVAIRAFLKFLIKNDFAVVSPEKLELSKVPPREVHYLSEEEIDTIMTMPSKHNKDSLMLARDEAILWFLYGTGLRVTELTSLERSDIRSDSKQFSIVGKGSKLRSVFMSQQARDKLVAYLKLRGDDSDYLFISLSNNSYGQRLTRNSIEDIVKRYKTLAGITKKVTPHTLRHSFATTLIKKGADIRAVQTLLGHASITTTQIYTHVDDKHLAKVHDLLDT